MSTTQMRTAIVVLLTDLTVHGDVIPEKTVIEVERSIRNDWFGSKLCRDATVEEIAEYRGQEHAADGFDEQLQLDRTQLIAEIKAGAAHKLELEGDIEKLQARKTELAGDLQALESDVADLGKQKEALAAEVKALEAAKAAAEKPVSAAKPK